MRRLSLPIERIQSHYPVVVVGSGYGGSIAASRLARAGQRVALLERGREIQVGQFPTSRRKTLDDLQIDLNGRHIGSETGLYDVRVNDDINVAVGCGLGGTSLINANVALRATPGVFKDPVWPRELRDDLDTIFEESYRYAEDMLCPSKYPGTPTLPKLAAHEKSAQGMGAPERFYRLPINVSFESGVNHVGVEQRACVLCGDCVTGCNYGAKNTLAMNYLPDARNHHAEVFTGVRVRRVEKDRGGWLVYYDLAGWKRHKFDAPDMFVRADVVILAAGSLGSTEILMRSKKASLSLSNRLGQRFSTNGDFIGFGYNCDVPIDGIGYGHHSPDGRRPVGPCITSVIDFRENDDPDVGIVLEDGTIHGAFAWFLPITFALGQKPFGRDTDRGVVDFIKEKWRVLVSLLFGAYYGAVRHTQAYLLAGHDDSSGRMYLKNDRLRIAWPDLHEHKNFDEADRRMYEATRSLGGTYVINPSWSKALGHDLITAHPLGGCVMADDAEKGVVNHKGAVFSRTSGTDVHDGLYVCDGAIIPRSLGANPLLTISALAERSMSLIADDHGWSIDRSLPSLPFTEPPAPGEGLRFTHANRGHFSTKVRDGGLPHEDLQRYFKGEKLGQEDESELDFILTVLLDEVSAFVERPEHQGVLMGTVVAPALSPKALTVLDGTFNLLVQDPHREKGRLLYYRFPMWTVDGKCFYFDGFRVVHDDPGYDGVWADMSIMYFTVHEGDSAEGAIVGTGILRLDPWEFVKQFRTLSPTNTPSRLRALRNRLRFLRHFVGNMIDVFGWRVLLPGSNRRRAEQHVGA